MLITLSEVLETPVSTLLGEKVPEAPADDLKVISEKLEIINLQLARRKKREKGGSGVKILVVEDERRLADSIVDLLQVHGFAAQAAYDGQAGYRLAQTGGYDLVVLDVMLPWMDGFTLARRLREERVPTPILMLTARSEVEDRVQGLNEGADYYLTKPFDTRELLACVQALLRRQDPQGRAPLTYGNTALDLATGVLSAAGGSIRLSARELGLMEQLLRARDRNLSKEALLTRVWGYDSNADENHVEVYVSFLRKKLASIGSNLQIEAVRRLGYHLEVQQDD